MSKTSKGYVQTVAEGEKYLQQMVKNADRRGIKIRYLNVKYTVPHQCAWMTGEINGPIELLEVVDGFTDTMKTYAEILEKEEDEC